ncbi:MAG: hypothetical protein JSR44_05870 [Spirochaetes bacterium]|nr:hypothetical protein [Spirochaetota bacterium]
MSRRTRWTVVTVSILIAIAIILFLNPCGSQMVSELRTDIAQGKISNPLAEKKKDAPKTNTATSIPAPSKPEPGKAVETKPVVEEVDTAPPVKLSTNEEIPNVAICASANFPSEAKPHVRQAVVTVRLIVDKYGKVRSVSPLSVEFPQEVAEDILPAMRKAFIAAGSRAFGAKRCPPHVVNGQNVGYAIEVPLQYKQKN